MNRGIPIFFNIDVSVGKNGNNGNSDDVLLVQFLLKKNGELVPGDTPEGAQANEVMKKVPLTGQIDQATIDGITAFQTARRREYPGTIVDGRVSPATHYRYGGHFFTIAAMNGYIRKFAPQVWPRLHDFSDCPAMLKVKIPQIL